MSRDARSCFGTWKGWPGSNLQIAWCGYGKDAQAKAARDATLQAKTALVGGSGRIPWRACRRRATWSAVRKLARSTPSARLCQCLVKANQLRRELVKEFGENCTEFSEAEHFGQGGSGQAGSPGPVSQRSPTDTCCVARQGA